MNTQYNYTVNPTVVVPGIFSNMQWVAQLPSAIYDRDLTGLTVNGPANSQVKVYAGNIDPSNLIDQTQRGASNTADYSGGPRHIPRSQIVNVVWSPTGGAFTGTELVSATFFVRLSA